MTDIERALDGRYRIERELGRGGMGAVYLARDLRLDRPVALKVLPPEFAANASLRERFLRETRTAASFSHPNIVPVHAVEEHEGVVAFAMGFVEGESVAERVKRQGTMDARSVARMLTDVAYALAYAHGRGVVHRDIKPDNIMIERATGRALLMDFGISRTISTQVAAAGLTRVGEVVGTPEYMSPEQASGDHVDGRSDVYSLGLVALFALTGRPIITGETTQQIIVRQLTETLPPSKSLRPDIPPALAEAIDRCVMKDPGARFSNAESLVEELDRAQLSAPEIPLAIRLFSQEAGTLGLVLIFFLIISSLMVQLALRTDSQVDAMLPIVVLFGVALTRVMQTNAEARRLAMAGFSVADVLKGMHAVVGEREALREQLRPNPEIQQRRRRTVRMAIGMLVFSALLFYAALQTRVTLAPGHYRTGLGGTTMVISSLVMFGVSFVLLLRSPFRMPIGERLFRVIWLGTFGRWFLVRAGRGLTPSATASTGTTGKSSVVLAAPMKTNQNGSAVTDPSLRDLDRRVRELEQWRRSQSGAG
jgi:eukaryotic-like serine/threonine-protein kinase